MLPRRISSGYVYFKLSLHSLSIAGRKFMVSGRVTSSKASRSKANPFYSTKKRIFAQIAELKAGDVFVSIILGQMVWIENVIPNLSFCHNIWSSSSVIQWTGSNIGESVAWRYAVRIFSLIGIHYPLEKKRLFLNVTKYWCLFFLVRSILPYSIYLIWVKPNIAK